MSSNERLAQSVPSGTRPWSIAARLALWYTCSAFVLVAVATGLLYWVLVTNVDREDDQFLVDTVQIIRALIRERPDDLAALRQEVDWEGTARRYARVYLRVLDERGRVVIETPGATPILARHALTPADAASEPGPGVELTSPAGTPYRMLAAWATLGGNANEQRLVQVALDRTAERHCSVTIGAGYRVSVCWRPTAVSMLHPGPGAMVRSCPRRTCVTTR